MKVPWEISTPKTSAPVSVWVSKWIIPTVPWTAAHEKLLTAYVGDAIGYVIAFTNGLKVYLSGDTALMADMKTIFNGFYKVKLAVLNIGSGEEASFAVNELIQPIAVIPSHANEVATKDGKVNPGTRTRQFIDRVKDRSVHVPLSGKTMEFDENARCIAGC